MLISIDKFIFGSIPQSSGYSILGKSDGVTEEEVSLLTTLSEDYDHQLFSVPPFDYSLIFTRLNKGRRALMEIFGGWVDHVGRPSRVMRASIFSEDALSGLGYHPFIVFHYLPSICNEISKDIFPLPSLAVCSINTDDLKNAWIRETRKVFGIIASMTRDEICMLHHFLKENPAKPVPCQSDHSSFLRAFSYILGPESRKSFECESFSLNNNAPRGICFRYEMYCQDKEYLLKCQEKTDVLSIYSPRGRVWYILRGVPGAHQFDVMGCETAKAKRNSLILLVLGIFLGITLGRVCVGMESILKSQTIIECLTWGFGVIGVIFFWILHRRLG